MPGGFLLFQAVEFTFAFLDFLYQLLSGRKVEFVFTGDDGGVVFGEGHPDGGVVFLRAEEDADGRVFVPAVSQPGRSS